MRATQETIVCGDGGKNSDLRLFGLKHGTVIGLYINMHQLPLYIPICDLLSSTKHFSAPTKSHNFSGIILIYEIYFMRKRKQIFHRIRCYIGKLIRRTWVLLYKYINLIIHKF